VIVPSASGSRPSTIAATAQASAVAQVAARTVAVPLNLMDMLDLLGMVAATGRPVRGSIGERPGRRAEVATAEPSSRSISCGCP
jgi:hypothetical protein